MKLQFLIVEVNDRNSLTPYKAILQVQLGSGSILGTKAIIGNGATPGQAVDDCVAVVKYLLMARGVKSISFMEREVEL